LTVIRLSFSARERLPAIIVGFSVIAALLLTVIVVRKHPAQRLSLRHISIFLGTSLMLVGLNTIAASLWAMLPKLLNKWDRWGAAATMEPVVFFAACS
jgi:hypothetical protein